MPHNKQNNPKRMPIWLMVAIDILLTALVLAVFSYFYLLAPSDEFEEGIVVNTPVNTPQKPSIQEPQSTSNSHAQIEPDEGEDADDDEEREPTWAEKFAEHFSDTIISTDTTYKSPNISITITEMTRGTERRPVVYYVADIYVADIECFRTYLAKDKFKPGVTENVLDMHLASGALLAVSGDYYGNTKSSLHGVVIRNGIGYRLQKTRMDICVLYNDGTMVTYLKNEFNAQEAMDNGAWQGWTFGPALLDAQGKPYKKLNAGPILSDVQPRCGIGYYEPGHYCFVTVDGRQNRYSVGVTLDEFAQIFEELGCVAAYNLDGGASATMTFNDKEVNKAIGGGREISDCLIIKEIE